MDEIVIFGASGHARVIIDILEKQNKYKIAGLFADTPELIGTNIMGYPIIDQIANLTHFDKGIIAIGDNYGRNKVADKIKKINNNFQFINAIHPNSVIGKDVKIGDGTVVVAGAIINANAIIGKQCIINTNSSVGHDVTVGNYSTIAPGVAIGGNAVIGELVTISMGSTVIQKAKIGYGTLIGAGSTVIRDIPDGVLAFGSPAKIIRERKIDEKYV
ncbi:acetyltransferase [Bacillus sp. SD088]|uniref:acetyltransferase n=1 Tax=Bacillus sp. SD088 TaxID=2782012 RepID=UPI001A968C7F|nr:acetyltransferase [Bacillus sp. SD088]MBO0991434.1 acetyltransferase [Bacillus sp. SD088]